MEQPWLLGMDIGGTKCAVALATPEGEIVERRGELTEASTRGPEETLQRLAAMARDILATRKLTASQIRGLGISCGGPLDRQTGTILAPPNLPEWKAVPVRAFMEKALGLPVRVENDANATALAEWKF